ncbi:MAG: SET domain-containing protein-lysine N-methyltransferase [Thermodesulfobacteriota bacterium]
MLHPAIVVRESGIQGFGLFTTKPIAKGETVWWEEKEVPRYHIDEVRRWPLDKQQRFFWYSWQVDEQWHTGPVDGPPTDPSDYMNHSCDPNTWYESDKVLVARRDIAEGEELTFDYAMSEIREDFRIPRCNCGAANCRKSIGPNDYVMSKHLQECYGSHVMPQVLKALARNSF